MSLPESRSLSVLLAGGGSAGHVNPLLATAQALEVLASRSPHIDSVRISVLGTDEGLEARLVPQAGFELHTIPKVPLPRRLSATAVRFPVSLRRALSATRQVLSDVRPDVVVGFGGYVSTPAYLCAKRAGIPIVIHEQNARPGLANKLGAKLTAHVATTFAPPRLAHGRAIGLPMRSAIADLDREATRPQAREYFGLDPHAPTVVVVGGSLGAARLNTAFEGAAEELRSAGVQILHLTGAGKHVQIPGAREHVEEAAPSSVAVSEQPPYVIAEYTDRMDLAWAAADLAVCRSGAGTVSELAAIGLPAIYVPLPVGNGEQSLNATDIVTAGGGELVKDSEVDADWVAQHVRDLVLDSQRLKEMSQAAATYGVRDADEMLAEMVVQAAGYPATPGAPPGQVPDEDKGI